MTGQIRQDVAAFVLAGGKSVRMGQEKAFVAWAGRTLLEQALETTQAISDDVRILGPEAKFAKFGVAVEDIYPDRGPLGGIHAALSVTDREFNLVLAVDLPCVTPALLAHLSRCAGETPKLCVAPRMQGGWEPLCAIYRRGFLAFVDSALQSGRNAIHPLLDTSGALALNEEELAAAGFPPRMFRNFNTMLDLASSEPTLHG